MAAIQCTVCGQSKTEKSFRCYARGRRTECKECEKTVQRCTLCNIVKPLEAFTPTKQKKSGRSSWCYACGAKRNKEKWRADPEKFNAPRRKKYETDYEYSKRCRQRTSDRAQTPEGRERIRAYNRSEAGKAREKRYRQTAKFREYYRWFWREYQKIRLNDDRRGIKVKARNAVNLAVLRKVITKPTACESGGKYGVKCSGRIEGHHHKGYEPEHWLDVEWLCRACHAAADRQQQGSNS